MRVILLKLSGLSNIQTQDKAIAHIIITFCSQHYNLFVRSIALNGGSAPKTYQSFNKLMDKLGTPAQALQAPDTSKSILFSISSCEVFS